MATAARERGDMREAERAVLPQSAAEPFLEMHRFEVSPNGNPHNHGIGYGSGNQCSGGSRRMPMMARCTTA